MRWPWLTSALRTLRFRLTLWNSFVVITVGLATLYAVRVGVRYTLVAESDATLKDELAVLALALTELYPDGQAINEELQRRNAVLEREVLELQSGTAGVEQRAREQLGLIREGEVFYQFADPESVRPALSAPAASAATAADHPDNTP